MSVASFETQCVVEGTNVSYQCYNVDSWTLNWLSGIDHDSVSFMTSNETKRDDEMLIMANWEFVNYYGNLSLIQCLPYDGSSQYAMLLVEGKWPLIAALSTLYEMLLNREF